MTWSNLICQYEVKKFALGPFQITFLIKTHTHKEEKMDPFEITHFYKV